MLATASVFLKKPKKWLPREKRYTHASYQISFKYTAQRMQWMHAHFAHADDAQCSHDIVNPTAKLFTKQ